MITKQTAYDIAVAYDQIERGKELLDDARKQIAAERLLDYITALEEERDALREAVISLVEMHEAIDSNGMRISECDRRLAIARAAISRSLQAAQKGE